jgi:hypothetical protein
MVFDSGVQEFARRSDPRRADQGAQEAIVATALEVELGVPLHAEGEGVVVSFDGFDQALVVDGRDAPGREHLIEGLVVTRHGGQGI